MLFAPREVPRYMEQFPTWQALQPKQLHTVGREAALAVPVTAAMRKVYLALRVPVAIVRGLDPGGSDAELEYEPAIHGGAWVEAPLPLALRFHAEGRGVGEQDYIDIDSGRFATLAPGVWFNARLSRAFGIGPAGPWQRLDLALIVENLADQVVYDQAGLPQPGRTVRLQGRLW